MLLEILLFSEHHKSHSLGIDVATFVIKEIKVQVAIASSELEVLHKLQVVHELQTVEYIEIRVFGFNQRVVDQRCQSLRICSQSLGHIVE